ncbi:MAG: DNA-formamidopyrimidine glycosylase [Parcubacteria group bacterium GW2011_GWA2_43_9b]|uniref:Formamidopyrimidine-DNA glycosylase n=1 Tax=Candidatus Portnoybacteria bacterium RIFCSPLOWO2_02_FULL_39_11 TaxID=1802001 RepID=A0A1G2FVA2_9BACT|nr:MAG: DNA-formamidopyrimidine glycosylase [Parcubacteria group bacterium GW2011_GWA2_43_9b]OGZ41558.1 MAG: DNA-formamidopyrimidine glycosylase [Candidatus Portnoybacteria bacterium RIFCSPLOWO2_02_FULL_39_11]
MPELPEVETICRQLSKLIVGKKIKETKVRLPKIVKAPLAGFRRMTAGAKIVSVGRRAKLIILGLDNGWSLLIHLKMTGQLIYESSVISDKLSAGKHTHVVFNFTDGLRLLFNDLRQFGYIKLVQTAKLAEFFIKEGTGPEPLAKEFTLTDFKALLLKKPKARIKQFLMDPKNIAGIGNIYSDEILFFARVHPLRRNYDLKKEKIKKIWQGIKKILPAAIKLKGTSANNYLDAFGRKGDFLKKLKVYGREGEPCAKCRGQVARIKLGGRSAHFCPSCQK